MAQADTTLPVIAVDPETGNTLFAAAWGGDGWHAVYEVIDAANNQLVHVWSAQRSPAETMAGWLATR